MLFVKLLTETEETTLKEAHSYHPKKWTRMRAHCILLSNKDYSIKEISDIHNVCRQTVSMAIYRWEKYGFYGLCDKQRSGRKKTLSKEQENEVLKKVNTTPRSLKNVIHQLYLEHQINISIDTLKRICKTAGMSWKRVRKSLKSKRNEADFEQSRQLINKLIQMDNNNEINLHYFDESFT